MFLGDTARAAEILLEASKLPGAAYWLKTLTADMLQRQNDRDTARQIWKALYEQSEPGAIRNNALYNVQRLAALDAVDAWQALVDRFHARTGRRPRSLGEARPAGGGVPPAADPTGTPFDYDRESGIVSIAKNSWLWRRSGA